MDDYEAREYGGSKAARANIRAGGRKTPIFRYTKQNKRRTSRNARSVTPSSSSSQGGDAAGDDDGTIIAIALVRGCVRTVSDNASARARF